MAGNALIPVGKIVGTHGIKGYLKVLSFAESVDTFAPGNALVLSRQGEPLATFRIASARPHKRVILLVLEGIASIEAAKQWIGCELCVDKASLPKPEEDSYYWYQIIGLQALTLDDRSLGRVEAIIPTGSNDVYVVRDGKQEVLVPAIDSVVVDIDLKENIMRVDLPEGLED
ncbi:MAG: 16S rRNA processing protein RimM [Desulfobacterales bacterium S5133MH4]|jgi:16S rRNA processing protein RimM|nr:MAG: 16S rRNA processing protein RimM [Desulfobacterales bacterium S5133MH4]